MSRIQYRSRSHRRAPTLAYIDKVRDYEPIAHWPLYERIGTTAHCLINEAQSGTHSGATLAQLGIGDGYPCPLYDGTNDHTNIYSATLASAFSGVAGTIAIWGKVSGAGVWTDSTTRVIFQLQADAQNYLAFYKPTQDNRIAGYYEAGNTAENIPYVIPSPPTTFFHLALTWDKNAGASGEVKFYYAGSQAGNTATGLGTWVGNLGNTGTCIGADSTTPTNVWDGSAGRGAVWTFALTATQILDLATLP